MDNFVNFIFRLCYNVIKRQESVATNPHRFWQRVNAKVLYTFNDFVSFLTNKMMLEKNKKKLRWLLLFFILFSALFLRSYQIETIPAGIYPDEAVYGTDALDALESGEFKIFYTNNYGREGLYINLQALAIKFLGNTIAGLKFWSITFGTLTVLGVYLLAREIFGSYRAGLLSAFLTAFSFWAINFSRIGFRATMVPFLLTFSFYFIFRGLRTKHLLNFILAGFFLGLGFHTYVAFRIAPAILVILFLFLTISKKNFIRENWKSAVVFSAAFLIALSPMIYDFLKYPDHFTSRSSAISVFSPEVNQGDLFGTLAKSFGLSLIKYNFWGDQNWRHNYPPYPVLNPVVGILFLSGFVYLVVKIFQLLSLRFKHRIRDEKLVVYTFLIGWFFVMLSPEFLTEEGLPHALRSIGTLPVVFIIAAVPVLWLFEKSKSYGNSFKYSIWSLIFFGLAFVAVSEPFKYFNLWAKSPDQHGQFNESYKNMALYLNNLPAEINKYVYANAGGKEMEDGLPISAHVIKYLTHDRIENLSYLRKNENLEMRPPFVLVLMNHEQEVIDRVKHFFPESTEEKLFLKEGYPSDFTVVKNY